MMGCEEPEEFDIYSDLITDFDAKSSQSNSQTPSVSGSFDQKSNCSDSEYGLIIAAQETYEKLEDIELVESNKEAIGRSLNNAAELDNELYVNFLRDKREEHFKNVQNELTVENVALKKAISKLTYENQKLCNQLTVLKNNISALFKTADAEIKRKNLQIHEIRQRLDGVLFRRQQGHFRRYYPESNPQTDYAPLTPPSSNKKLIFGDSDPLVKTITDKTSFNSELEKVEPIVLKEETALDSRETKNCVERGIKTKTLWVTSKYLLKDESTRYEKKNLGKKGTRRLNDEKPNDEVRLLNYNLWKRKRESPVKPPILVPKKENTVVLKDKTNSREAKASLEKPRILQKRENKFEKISFKEEENLREIKESAAKENVNNDKRLAESPKKKLKAKFSPKKFNCPQFRFTFKIPKISKDLNLSANLNSTEDLTYNKGEFTQNNRENKSEERKRTRPRSDRLETFQERSQIEYAPPQTETRDSKITFESKLRQLPPKIRKDGADNLERQNYQIEPQKRRISLEKPENWRKELCQIKDTLDSKIIFSQSESKMEQKLPELPLLIENNDPTRIKVPRIEIKSSKSPQNGDNYIMEPKKRKLSSEINQEIKDPRKPPGSGRNSVELKLPKFALRIENESAKKETRSSIFDTRNLLAKESNEKLLAKNDDHPKLNKDDNKNTNSINGETNLSLSNEFELILKEIQDDQLEMKEIKDDQLEMKEIQDDQLKLNKTEDDHLKPNEIEDDQLKLNEIQDDQLKLNEIQDDQLKLNEIQDDPLKLNEIQDDPLKLNEIQDSQLKPKEIQDDQLKPKEIQDDQLKLIKIQDDQLKLKEIQDEQLKLNEIQDDWLKPKEIQDDGLKLIKIQDDHLKLMKIQDDWLKPKEIQDDHLKLIKIQDDQLKLKEIQDEQLKPKEIQDDHLKLSKIQDDQLKPKKIQDNQLKVKNNSDKNGIERLLKGIRGKTKEHSELESSLNSCKPKTSQGDKVSKQRERSKKVSSPTHFNPKEANCEKIRPNEDYASEQFNYKLKKTEKTSYESSLSKNDSKSKPAWIPRLTNTKKDSERSYTSKSTIDKCSKDKAQSNVSFNKHDEIIKSEKKLISKSKKYSSRNQRSTEYHSPQKRTHSKCNELQKLTQSSMVPKQNEREFKKALSKKTREPFSKMKRRSTERDSFIKSKELSIEKSKLYSRYDSRRESKPKYSTSYKATSSVSRKSNFPSSSIKDKRLESSIKESKNSKQFGNLRNAGDNRRKGFQPLTLKSDSEKNDKQTTELATNLAIGFKDILNNAGLKEKRENPNSDEVEKLDLVSDISNNASFVNSLEPFTTSKPIGENRTKNYLHDINDGSTTSKGTLKINNCKVNLPITAVSDPDLEDGEVLSDTDDFFTF